MVSKKAKKVLVGKAMKSVKGGAGSGQATGKRQHKPIIIVKEWDTQTP